jgi:hypothetical protein
MSNSHIATDTGDDRSIGRHGDELFIVLILATVEMRCKKIGSWWLLPLGGDP